MIQDNDLLLFCLKTYGITFEKYMQYIENLYPDKSYISDLLKVKKQASFKCPVVPLESYSTAF